MTIKVSRLSKHYGKTTIFDGVSFNIHAGEKVIITGPSGCGKTTLLRVLAGLEQQDGGTVAFKSEGEAASSEQSNKSRSHNIAWIPQDLGLWPNMSVYQNVAMAYKSEPGGQGKRNAVRAALEKCQIVDLKKRRPTKLSAGEQQRVALARALVCQPKILLLDEPFASLDLVRRKHFFEILKGVWTDDLIVIVVTHDPFDAMGLEADRVIVIEDGELKEDTRTFGQLEKIYTSSTLQVWDSLLNG